MSVEALHREASAMTAKWQRCRDVLAGQDAVRAAGTKYLPLLGGHAHKGYLSYLNRALFFPATARTLTALSGLVFSKDPDVKTPDAIAPHLHDISLDGTPMSDFALNTLREVLSVGRVGVLVDMQSDATPVELRRPYMQLYEAEQIVNWRTEMLGGRRVPTLVVLKEPIERRSPGSVFWSLCETQYRVLALVDGQYTVTVWSAIREGKYEPLVTMVPMFRGQPLSHIPFTVIGPSGTRWPVEKPPLLDMVDVNVSHYQTSADLEQARHMVALPTPWVTGYQGKETEIPIGPGIVWKLEGANASAGFLEFKGAGLSELRVGLAEKEEMMAVLGARLIERAQAKNETAEAVISRNTASHASLKVIAGAVSLGLTTALRWHALWAGVPDNDVLVELNREFFDTTLTGDEIKTLVLAWQAGGISFETLYANLSHGNWSRPGVTVDEERAAIDAEGARLQAQN